MAWTAPATWTVGQLVTAATMNTHVRDNLNYLKGQAGAITLDDALTIGATGTAKALSLFGNADSGANGPLTLKNTSAGTIGTALTLDATGASGGRKYSFLSSASGASIAGAWAIYDATAAAYR